MSKTPSAAIAALLSSLNFADEKAVREAVAKLGADHDAAVDLGVAAVEEKQAEIDTLKGEIETLTAARDQAVAQAAENLGMLQGLEVNLVDEREAHAKLAEAHRDLQTRLATAPQPAPQPGPTARAARPEGLGKPPKGEAWLVSGVTVRGKDAEGKMSDIAPGDPFSLDKDEAESHIARFGGALL
jgi:hypothetical protein